MGLLGDAIDPITDGFDTVKDTIESGCETVGVCDDSTQDNDGSGSDGIDDTIDDTEDSINDGVDETTEPIDDGLDEGTDAIFDGLQGGVDTFEGFLNTIADGFEWFDQHAVPIIPLSGAQDVFHVIFGGLAGLFNAFAGGVAFLEGIPAFLSTLNGWEGAGFLLGLLLVIVGLYIIVSGVLSGEILLFPSYTEDVFDAVMGSWIGLGLMIWSAQNFTGSVLIAGTGTILLFYAIVSDEGQLLVFGGPATLLGFFMLFAALKAGFVANLLFTSATVFALVYSTEYLEKRIAPSVTQNQSLLLEGEN